MVHPVTAELNILYLVMEMEVGKVKFAACTDLRANNPQKITFQIYFIVGKDWVPEARYIEGSTKMALLKWVAG